MFRLRRARPEDHAAVARLYRELGVPEDPPSVDVFTQGMLPRVWVAEAPEGDIAAYTFYDTYGDIGYVRNLVTDPAWRRQGLGRRLMSELGGQLRAAGLRRWCLGVKPDNGPAIALYRALGLEARHQVVVLRCQWPSVLAFPPSPACEVGPAAPEEDAELESAFGLHPGQIAGNRALPRRHPLRLRDAAGRPIAYANWVPDHPGAHPFALRDLAYAQALFAEMHRRRSPSQPDLMVNTQAGSDVEDLLRRAGAAEVMRVDWMEGPIP